MDLLPTHEQIEISDSSAAYVSSRLSIERMRTLFEAGTTPALDDSAWSGAAELGWFVLGLAEQYDGVGCGLADEALLIREVGRGIAAGPFVSTVLGARVAAIDGNQALADEIGAGRRVGLVVPDAVDAVAVDGSVTGSVQLLDATDGLALVVTPLMAAIVELDSLDAIEPVACIDPASNLQRARGNGAAPLASVAASVEPIEWRCPRSGIGPADRHHRSAA